jgi:DNA repair protein RadA/Sms
MARGASVFVCQQCGVSTPKWSGQCPSCGVWNSLVETVVSTSRVKGKGRRAKSAVKPVKLSEVEGISEKRIPTNIGEFDRVLGGGIVPGSVILVAGEPGIGKSTLLTQLALRLAGLAKGKQILYVCGEESPAQIKMRIDRISDGAKGIERRVNLLFLPEVNVDVVIASVEKEKPGLVIVDSIQTMVTQDLTSSAGSISQTSECTSRLLDVAKRQAIPMLLVGHVTKEGSIAGPKVLEHMVDTVLELSGDRQHEFRLLRASKNRFGATDEVGIFVMEDSGMHEVANPSDRFLADRQKKVPGSSIVCVLEGTRPMLVEIQALVVPSNLAVPRRVASGVDQRRVQILVAVLTKRCGVRLGNMDVYVNVAGGLNIREPASDFGIALAIASSAKNKALPYDSVVVGEIGLLGEVRKVGRLKQRLSEAKAQGFKRVITANEFPSLQRAISSALR